MLRLHTAPPEGQQLARQAGRAVGRFDDVLCGRLSRRRIAVVLEQRQREALDDRQDVVEVVGDAAGKLADGFHFLRLPQLGLELTLAGDVTADPEHRGDLAVAIAQRCGMRAQPAPDAGQANDRLELGASPAITR